MPAHNDPDQIFLVTTQVTIESPLSSKRELFLTVCRVSELVLVLSEVVAETWKVASGDCKQRHGGGGRAIVNTAKRENLLCREVRRGEQRRRKLSQLRV